MFLQFFVPLMCINICIQYNKDGRPSGDADVDFASHEEAQEALRRNKALMRELSRHCDFCYVSSRLYCTRAPIDRLILRESSASPNLVDDRAAHPVCDH